MFLSNKDPFIHSFKDAKVMKVSKSFFSGCKSSAEVRFPFKISMQLIDVSKS